MVVPSKILQKLIHFLLFIILVLQVYIMLLYCNDNIDDDDKCYKKNNHYYYRAKNRSFDEFIFNQNNASMYSDYDGEEENDYDDGDKDNDNNNNTSNIGRTSIDSLVGTSDDAQLSYFSKCYDDDDVDHHDYDDQRMKIKKQCVAMHYPVYDKHTHKKILTPDLKQKYLLPNSKQIPRGGGGGGKKKKLGYCGFGKLLYDTETKEWSCQCFAPDYFGGEMCDAMGSRLVKENKCTRVAEASNILNTDISTFHPFIDGICSRCVSPDTQVPVINAGVPLCQDIITEYNEDEITDNNNSNRNLAKIDRSNQCKYDALHPDLYSSPNNFYVLGYGCVCDYHNGFVEVTLPSRQFDKDKKDYDIKRKEVSHACIKIGKDKPSSFHRTDVAYYTLNGNFKPIQVHSYKHLEYPFNVVFANAKELLVKQRIAKKSDNHDWLNRVIKPKRKHPIRRLDYPRAKWPVVHKKSLVNHYNKRDTTYPISAERLANGSGYETKHWYETSSDRHMANAVWGRPVIYTYYTGTPWTGRVTLNPLGAVYGKYYGATLMTKPGQVVRLDVRGYESEKKISTTTTNTTNTTPTAITIPPDYKSEMMDESSIIYVPILFLSYEIED